MANELFTDPTMRSLWRLGDRAMRVPRNFGPKEQMQIYRMRMQAVNKELDRRLREQQSLERQKIREEAQADKSWRMQRAKEEAAWQKWSEGLKKQQTEANVRQFSNYLISQHGTQDDKGRLTLPMDVQKRAAKFSEMARTDPKEAIRAFQQDAVEEQQTAVKWKETLPAILKEREKTIGRKLTQDEIAGMHALGPNEQRQILKMRDEHLARQKEAEAGRQAKADQALIAPEAKPEVAGGKPRYGAQDFVEYGPIVQLKDRPDLSFEEARQAFNDLMDRGVEAGAVPAWLGTLAKNMPLSRDAVDPNTPLRRGLSHLGQAAKGTWENIKAGNVPGTGVDVLPNLEPPEGSMALSETVENRVTAGAAPSAPKEAGAAPPQETPEAAAGPSPEPPKPVPGAAEWNDLMGRQRSSGLVQGAKNWFVGATAPSAPGNREDLWNQTAAESARTPVGQPSPPAEPDLEEFRRFI